jgi:carbamoylphosphate synthase large subunit
LELKFTGNGLLTLAACIDKIITKQILISNDIPTPYYAVKKLNEQLPNNINLNYPLIIKPLRDCRNWNKRKIDCINNIEIKETDKICSSTI